MKKYLILFLIVISIDAKIIEVKQLFNKQLVKVIKKPITISKTFYGNTALNDTKVSDVTLRFDGFVQNLKANEEHKFKLLVDWIFRNYRNSKPI